MPSWLSMMNSCGSTCRIFWSAGNRHRLGRIDHAIDVAAGHFLVADGDDAVRVEAAHVAAGDAGVHRVNLAARHQLGFFDRALDRLHRRLDVDHHALLEAARGVRADADHFDARHRARPRRRSRPPWRCRCRVPRADCGRYVWPCVAVPQAGERGADGVGAFWRRCRGSRVRADRFQPIAKPLL